jgi:hypothetical protein
VRDSISRERRSPARPLRGQNDPLAVIQRIGDAVLQGAALLELFSCCTTLIPWVVMLTHGYYFPRSARASELRSGVEGDAIALASSGQLEQGLKAPDDNVVEKRIDLHPVPAPSCPLR